MNKFPIKYRILFVILVVGIYLIYNAYPCLKLSLTGFPGKVKENLGKGINAIVFLYGRGICGTCPQGEFLYSVRDRPDILFIVPEEFSANEKENLKTAFMLKGKIVSGDSETAGYFETILDCSNVKGKKNYYAELDKNKKIKGGKVF